jgi:hypothetical protein
MLFEGCLFQFSMFFYFLTNFTQLNHTFGEDSLDFEFQTPTIVMLEQGIMVAKEVIFYNWTNNNTMTFLKSRKSLCEAKEMHPLTLEVLIRACSKLGSFVIDFVASTSM